MPRRMESRIYPDYADEYDIITFAGISEVHAESNGEES